MTDPVLTQRGLCIPCPPCPCPETAPVTEPGIVTNQLTRATDDVLNAMKRFSAASNAVQILTSPEPAPPESDPAFQAKVLDEYGFGPAERNQIISQTRQQDLEPLMQYAAFEPHVQPYGTTTIPVQTLAPAPSALSQFATPLTDSQLLSNELNVERCYCPDGTIRYQRMAGPPKARLGDVGCLVGCAVLISIPIIAYMMTR